MWGLATGSNGVGGEGLVAHWANLDQNADGKVSLGEFKSFFGKLEAVGKDKSWLADLLYQADIGVMAHVATEVTARRMALGEIELVGAPRLLRA